MARTSRAMTNYELVDGTLHFVIARFTRTIHTSSQTFRHSASLR
jgi:hypothetical protein